MSMTEPRSRGFLIWPVAGGAVTESSHIEIRLRK
ncbi:hypothetical protein Spla01_04340 [Streptomyces platensis]|uniref:Uncharacterized protein n=1 Tax=Streptomyces platensis TaxID=58346 RepID=A0ABX3XUC3_STRPT|nr:hypothetical protein BG653_04161 [Streptomyces platensis]